MAYQTINTSDFVNDSVKWMKQHITKYINEKGSCVVGLSGGSTPGPIYEELGKDSSIDWAKVFVFAVDERYIAAAHKDSNRNLFNTTLQKNANIPANNVVWPNTALELSECVKDYQKRLQEVFASQGGPDVVTVGLGPDGHIASLFPPVPSQGFDETIAVIHTTTTQFAVFDRITVTTGTLKNAKAAVFLLKGKDKLEVWEKMISEPNKRDRWPAQEVLAAGKTTLIITV